MLARISAELPEAPMRGFFRAVMKRQGSRDARPRSGLTLTRDERRTLSPKGARIPCPSAQRRASKRGAGGLLPARGGGADSPANSFLLEILTLYFAFDADCISNPVEIDRFNRVRFEAVKCVAE